MAIELARVRELPKPWGVVDPRPWSNAGRDGSAIGELCFERSSPAAGEPALLLKVLLTRQPLSIQVHPDDEIAQAMGLPNGKTEAWYVLSAEPGAKVALGLKQTMTAPQLRAAIGDGSIAGLVAWQGVVAGDIIAVPAGTIHAIGAGLVIAEIQQRSDTTFRLFDHGRSREIHTEPAMVAARRHTASATAAPLRLSNERLLLAANAHFVFERIELSPESNWCLEASRETWLLVVDGAAQADAFDVVRGNALFAKSDRIQLRAGARGAVCLVAYTGEGGPLPHLLQRPDGEELAEFSEPIAKQPRFISDRVEMSSTIMGTVQ